MTWSTQKSILSVRDICRVRVAQHLATPWNQVCNLLWGRGEWGKPSSNPNLLPRLKLSFLKNLVKTKVSLHNSSIQRNRSVFFFLVYLYLYHTMLIFHCHFHLILENWLQLEPLPPGFLLKLHHCLKFYFSLNSGKFLFKLSNNFFSI